MVVKFVAPREALVDPRTGLISTTWYRLFLSLFTQVSATPVANDFTVDPITNGDTVAMSLSLRQDVEQQLGLGDLAARVAEIEKALDGLRVGGTPL